MQLKLIEIKGFKIKKPKEIKEEKFVVVPAPALPERLEGKIRRCEECGTIQEVKIFECMYLCEPCYTNLSSPQEPKIIFEAYPKRYVCKICGLKAVMFDDLSRACFCITHAISFFGRG